MAAACARVAVARYVEKAGRKVAEQSTVWFTRFGCEAKEAVRQGQLIRAKFCFTSCSELGGESQEKAERDRVPEFVKRHEGKAGSESGAPSVAAFEEIPYFVLPLRQGL